MAYDGRLLRLAQERYEADRTRREAELAAQREEIYTRHPGCGKFRSSCAARPAA